jgi:hypothetical protein
MQTDLFLVGNSHNVALKKFAEKNSIEYQGGTLGPDPITNESFFDVEGELFKLRPTPRLLKPEKYENLLTFEGTILSTIGFNSIQFVRKFSTFLNENELHFEEVSRAMFERVIKDYRCGALEFYQTMRKFGRDVYFTCSSQDGFNNGQSILRQYEDFMIQEIEVLGGVFIDTRDELLTEDGHVNKIYQHEDKMHGNEKWAELVFDRLSKSRNAKKASINMPL